MEYCIVNGELYHHGIKGQKWGRRRYQNPDGTLTPAGRKRYGTPSGAKGGPIADRDGRTPIGALGGPIADRDGRTPTGALGGPNYDQRNASERLKQRGGAKDDGPPVQLRGGYTKKDVDAGETNNKSDTKDVLNSTKKVADESAKATNKLKEINAREMKKQSKNKDRMDLSDMTDQELRDQINRANLERQYNDMFNDSDVSRGRERVDRVLEVAGDVITVTGSAVAIAVGILELKDRLGL